MHRNFAVRYPISHHRNCAILHVHQRGTRTPAFPEPHVSLNLDFVYVMEEKYFLIAVLIYIYFIRMRLSISSNVKETLHLGPFPTPLCLTTVILACEDEPESVKD